MTPDTSTPDELQLRGKVVAYTDILPGIPDHWVVVFTDQTVLSGAVTTAPEASPLVAYGTGELRPDVVEEEVDADDVDHYDSDEQVIDDGP